MRKQLINIEKNKRYRFYATFERYYFSYGSRGMRASLLFDNITDENFNPVDGGVCFDDLKCFIKINLQPGNRISFNARVLDYIELYPDNGYSPRKYYRLFYPTKVEKLVSVVTTLENQLDKFKINIADMVK